MTLEVTRPNGEADPRRVRAGRHFTVNWAFIHEGAPVRSFVYEVYDQESTLVYVGVTDAFPGRWSAHLSRSWWIPEVDVQFVILTGYASRSDARMVEATLIDERVPRYNRKLERKFLRLARGNGVPDDSMTAELIPVEGGLR